MKYSTALLLLLLFCACHKKTPQTQLAYLQDSIDVAIDQTFIDTLPNKTKHFWLQKAERWTLLQNNDSIARYNLAKIAHSYGFMNEMALYKKTAHLIVRRSLLVNDTERAAKAYILLGDYHTHFLKSDSAYYYFYTAEKEFVARKNYYYLANVRNAKAYLQLRCNDYLSAEITTYNALRANKLEPDEENEISAYNHLGLVYYCLEEFDKAINFHKKAANLAEKSKEPGIRAMAYVNWSNTANANNQKKQHTEAKKICYQLLAEPNFKTKGNFLYPSVLAILAEAKFHLKETAEVPKLFTESLHLSDSLRIDKNSSSVRLAYSDYFAAQKDTLKALALVNEALVFAKKKGFRGLVEPYKRLAVLQPKKAAFYTKEILRINNLIDTENRNLGNKFTRIEYETETVIDENIGLLQKIEKLVLAFSFFVILSLLLYIYKERKTKQRELLYKQQQQQANEEIYNLMISQQQTIEETRVKEKNRLAQELHDGILGRLFGVRMHLDGLNRQNTEESALLRKKSLSDLQYVEQDLREISHELSREKNELVNNFVAISNNLFEEQRKNYASKLHSSIDPTMDWEVLSNATKINLYRIMQESLQNCNKYAQAKNITIDFEIIENQLQLSISDDGIGFTTRAKKTGIGIKNMQSRVLECGGVFEIISQKNQGTAIKVTVPLPN